MQRIGQPADLGSPVGSTLTSSMTWFAFLRGDPVMTIQGNTHEAKTQLSKLLAQVQAGEDVVIAKAGRNAVLLYPSP